MFYRIVKAIDRIFPIKSASAHCDIPCGIYDPTPAQINALTVVRMMDLMADLDEEDDRGKLEYHNSMTRYIEVKEDHAEKTKHEIRVIYGDYIKDAHIEKHPELPELFQNIMQLGSKARQSPAREDGLALIDAVNQFSEIFWATKGVKTKIAKAPYAPALEMVYPDL